MSKNQILDKISYKNLYKPFGYINGEWIDSSTGYSFKIYNPSNNQIIATMPEMGPSETKYAIEVANQAFEKWKKKTAKERCSILRKWYNLVLDNIDDLAIIMTYENGKPLKESKAEIIYASSFIDWFSEEGKRAYGRSIPATQPDKRIITIKQPVGVCALITPWNFPAAMITRKVAPALAAGCSVIIKPAEQTPLSASALVYLAEKAGIPKGVINLLVANNPIPIGKELCDNFSVRKISFTGSTEVGKILIKDSANSVKRISMELGGNAPLIVFNDADIEVAVKETLASKYRNSGQTCVCANRIFVQEGIYEKYSEALAKKVNSFNVGDGFEDASDIGPLIDESGLKKVERHLEDAISKGAKVLTGGKQPSLGGLYFEPTVLTEVQSNMVLFKEETFGPLAPLFKFKDISEVVNMANNTNYGLAGYIFTKDINTAWQVSEELQFGMVGINSGILSTEVAPFGGVKESGIGREGAIEGIDEYMEIKYLCFGNIL